MPEMGIDDASEKKSFHDWPNDAGASWPVRFILEPSCADIILSLIPLQNAEFQYG